MCRLNALYVGLARSAGLPGRHVYGLRIAKSDLGYKSLGLPTDKATKGQHCRTEVYLREHGWVPVDPADVCKVVLEEPPGNRPLGDDTVSKARKRLFGSWEMNWMAYKYAPSPANPWDTVVAISAFAGLRSEKHFRTINLQWTGQWSLSCLCGSSWNHLHSGPEILRST